VATGTDGLLRIQGSAAGVGGSTSYLASVSYLGYDGFRTDPTDPDGAPYSRAERLNANAHLSWSTWGGDLGLTVNFVDLDAENPGSVNDSVLALGDRPAHGFNVIQQTRKEMRQAQAGLSWEGPIGGLRGEATVYGITRTLDNPIPPRVIDLDRLAGGLRATVGSTSGTDTGPGWLVGTDLELQHDDRLNFENDRGERGEVTLDQLETVRGVGLFGRGMIGLGQRGRLIAGLRYDRSSFQADDRMPGRFPGESIEDASGSRTMDQLSPSLGVSFSPRPDHSVFANVSSLFGTPTTTELANQADGSRGFNPDLEPQTGWALEAGARGHLGDTGGYEVALFRTELNDELIPFESVEQPGRTFFKNAGSSRYQGFEAALFGQLGSVFDGRLTYTYTSAEFVEYIVDGTDLAGNRIPGQAPHRLEGVVRGEQGRGFAELRLLYMDEIPANDANTAASESYGLVDLRAGLRELDLGRLVVSPFAGVTNLFDQTYVASVVVNAFGGRFFEPGPSRGVYVGLSAAWPGT